MIAEIEDAIVSYLTTQIADARIKVMRGFEGIPQPAVHVSTEEGRFEKETNTSWKLTLTIYVDVIFKSLSTEAQRRAGLYKIMEGIVQSLLLQTLGLAIQPLEPKSFRDVTSEELLRDGFAAYTIEMSTYYHVTASPPGAAQDLLRIGLSYYLEPEDIEEVTDVVTLT